MRKFKEMATKNTKYPDEDFVGMIPVVSDYVATYHLSTERRFDFQFVSLLNEISTLKLSTIAKWLNITPKTFKNYTKNKDLVLKDATKEHVILILSLYKHGEEVFGSFKEFERWISTPNVLLDSKSPSDFLDTTSGIRFIDSRLTAIEYGENV